MITTFLLVSIILLIIGSSFFAIRFKFSPKLTYTWLIIAAACLLISTIALQFLYKNDNMTVKRVTEHEVDDMLTPLSNGQLGQISDEFILSKREIPFEGDTLHIERERPEEERLDEATVISIERKEVNDGIIEETLYKPSFIVNYYDFTDLMEFAVPIWQDNRLHIPSPKMKTFHFNFAQDYALLTQYTFHNNPSTHHISMSAHRDGEITLTIPKDLQIIKGKHIIIQEIHK